VAVSECQQWQWGRREEMWAEFTDRSWLGDASEPRLQGRSEYIGEHTNKRSVGTAGKFGWSEAVPWHCLDGRSRRLIPEPELFPLADGIPARVGRLRAYGNAIVPQVAEIFVREVMELMMEVPAHAAL
jgi:DNA (cytosine-5)-methyltransferase 1